LLRQQPTGLEASQDRKACGGGRKMLQRVSAQQVSRRKNRIVGKFEDLGQRVQRRGDDPKSGAGVFRRVEDKQQQ
jgi:hypothetical protein